MRSPSRRLLLSLALVLALGTPLPGSPRSGASWSQALADLETRAQGGALEDELLAPARDLAGKLPPEQRAPGLARLGALLEGDPRRPGGALAVRFLEEARRLTAPGDSPPGSLYFRILESLARCYHLGGARGSTLEIYRILAAPRVAPEGIHPAGHSAHQLRLGELLVDEGEYQEAGPALARARVAMVRVHGELAGPTTLVVQQQGRLLYLTGQVEAGRALLESRRSVLLGGLGPGDQTLLDTLVFQAGLEEGLPDLERARSLLLLALQGRSALYGVTAYCLAEDLQRLGDLSRRQGNRDGALRFFADSIAQRSRVLGPLDPDSAWAHAQRGMILLEEGEAAKASAAFRQVTKILERVQEVREGLGEAETSWMSASTEAVRDRAFEALRLWQGSMAKMLKAGADLQLTMAQTFRLGSEPATRKLLASSRSAAEAVLGAALGTEHPAVLALRTFFRVGSPAEPIR